MHCFGTAAVETASSLAEAARSLRFRSKPLSARRSSTRPACGELLLRKILWADPHGGREYSAITHEYKVSIDLYNNFTLPLSKHPQDYDKVLDITSMGESLVLDSKRGTVYEIKRLDNTSNFVTIVEPSDITWSDIIVELNGISI